MGGGDEHGASARLESILTDSSAPRAERMWAAGAIELGMLMRLAVPAVIMYMINFLMSMSTQIFSGHLGSLELAAASLGNTGVQMFAYGLMIVGGFGRHGYSSRILPVHEERRSVASGGRARMPGRRPRIDGCDGTGCCSGWGRWIWGVALGSDPGKRVFSLSHEVLQRVVA